VRLGETPPGSTRITVNLRSFPFRSRAPRRWVSRIERRVPKVVIGPHAVVVDPERLGTAEETRGDSQPSHVGDSLWEYANRVIGHWWWLVLGLVATCLGLYCVIFAHVLGLRSWVWFAIALATFSVAQFLAFHEVRKERNEVLTAPAQDKVSIYAARPERSSPGGWLASLGTSTTTPTYEQVVNVAPQQCEQRTNSATFGAPRDRCRSVTPRFLFG
jgi:hypothetical protein